MTAWVGIGATVGALALVATANAGMAPDPRPGDSLLGKSDGIAYVIDPDFAPGATSLEGAATCPDVPGRWRVVGGGFELSGGADASQRVASSTPADMLDLYGDNDTVSDDFWRIGAVVSVGTTLNTYATCAKWPAIKYKRIETPDSPSGERKHMVACGRGEISGGGGSIGSSNSYVSSMFPKSLERWSFKAFDGVGGIGGMNTHVVCARSQDFVRVKASDGVPASATSPEVVVECPGSGSVVGGGAKSSDVPGALSLRATAPFDGVDDNEIPEDGWVVRAYNTTAVPQELTAFAICAA